jgi:hypothetical protein
MNKLFLAVALLFSTPALAADPVWEAEGFFVYREDQSCALYADFDTGTMLRISDRRDENRIYVMAVNDRLDRRLVLGDGPTMHLTFEGLPQMGQSSAAIVVRNSDGRKAVSGDSFGHPYFFDAFSRAPKMHMRANGGRIGSEPILIEEFDIAGGRSAIEALKACTAQYFTSPRRVR